VHFLIVHMEGGAYLYVYSKISEDSVCQTEFDSTGHWCCHLTSLLVSYPGFMCCGKSSPEVGQTW
jgi:hypothetical protein